MTLKSYLRMLLAAVTLMFVTTGCNDDEEKVGPPPSYTFGIAVSDVTETEATVTVTPSNDQATYYYGAVKKADFDAFESDAAYAQNILATLKAAADRKVLSLEEYLQTALSKGSSPKKIADLMAGTDYYAVAIGILTDGRFTSDLVKEAFKTEKAPESAPELTITMTPGVQGENTDTAMSVDFKVSGSEAVSAKYLLGATSIIETMHGQGKTDEAILAEYGVDFTAKELEELNSEEGTQGWYFDELDPQTSYTVIAKVTNASGISTLKTAEKSTAAAQGGGEGPELKLTMTVGDKDGNNRTTNIYVVAQSSAATSASYRLSLTSTVEQKLAAGETYESIAAGGNAFPADWMKGLNGAGIGLDYDKCQPGESWTMVLKVTDANGNSTVKHVEATTDTGQGGGEGPNLAITAIPGKEGADTQTCITAIFKVTGTPAAVSGSYILAEKALVDQIASEKSLTYEQITEAAGNKFKADELTKLNANGIGWYFPDLTPGTEHIVMAKVTDAAGNSTFKYVLASTDPDGEASDAYKAWLGTWTVTSTSSRYAKKAYTFDVTFKQKVANSTYSVEGWTASIFRDQPDKSPYFPTATFENGGFYFANAQTFGSFDMGDGYGMADLTYVVWFKLNGSYYYNNEATVDGKVNVGMVGTMNEDKTSAVVKGTEGSFNLGGTILNATMECMDFLYILDEKAADGTSIFGVLPGKGFEYTTAQGSTTDYLIGPYTMVKKSSGASVSSISSAPVRNDNTTYAFRLSSVLSASALSAPAKQHVMLEGKKAVINQIDFVRPAAVYEATISNIANIEKPIGLKKHFIKK